MYLYGHIFWTYFILRKWKHYTNLFEYQQVFKNYNLGIENLGKKNPNLIYKYTIYNNILRD